MIATILGWPNSFDRVDRVKAAVGQDPARGDDRLWILGGTLRFEVNGGVHCVPAGFTTDGSSIPRLGQLVAGNRRWREPQCWAALAHDWLYTAEGVAKIYADLTMRALLEDEGVGWWARTALYLAARWAGGGAWSAEQEAGPMIYEESQ